MSKSPEEYFLDEELSPEERTEEVTFSETERAFLEKYLGLERDILDRLGIEEAAEPQAVELSEVEPPPPLEQTAPPEEEAGPTEHMPGQAVLVDEEEEAEPAPEVEAVHEEGVEPAIEDAVAEAPRAEPAVGELAEAEPSLDDEIRSQEEIQLVSFFLADQEFTIPINAVQEVVRYMEPTAVPESHDYLAGIVNMRGRVTPVLRLSVILGKKDPPATEQKEVEDDKRRFFIVCRKADVQVALLVERVHTMYRVPQSAIEWNIEQSMGADVDIVRGLLRSGDGLVGIVSLERMLEKVGMQGGLGG